MITAVLDKILDRQIGCIENEFCNGGSGCFNEIVTEIEKLARMQREYNERTLAKIITNYDFIVGSIECKHKLMEVLPEGANIICSRYVESPTTIYAVKRFDVMELLYKVPEVNNYVER